MIAAVALLGACSTGTPTPARTGPLPSASPTPTDAAPTTPGPSAAPAIDETLLTDVARSAAAGPEELRDAASIAVADGRLSGLVDPSWQDVVTAHLAGWPVVVGEASLAPDGVVDLDVVLVAPPDDDGTLVLRWLPAATALGDAVETFAVQVDRATVEVEVDAPGARVLVPVGAGVDHLVRVTARYRVPERVAVADDGTPAGFGLLSRTPEAVMLGHWLPLVALPGDDGPMQARGDVGAFAPGVFSVVVHHEGQVVSGGDEQPCPDPADGCTWLRGVGIRDLAAVVLTAPVTATGDGVAVHLDASSPAVDRIEAVADEAARVVATFDEELSPLPWATTDVVAAPIAPGAAGMEFPGIVWIDPGAWPEPGADLGSYVLAHELGHQWFHALVGNGSLSAPVVDESLAQYLSVVAFDALFGAGAGADLAARSLGGRHDRALADGIPDEAPAQPLAAFTSERAYGAAVYGRGGQAWVDAEEVAGREVVLAALRELVTRDGLGQADVAGVLDVVRETSPRAADTLAAGWGVSG